MTASSKQPARTSPGSRFIPREEIGKVAAWHFSAIGGSSDPEPQIEEAEEEQVDLMALQALQEAREQAYAEGFTQGHQAGAQEVRDAFEVAMQKQATEMAERMASMLNTMSDDLLEKEQSMARQMLELACELARQVVRQEIKSNTSLLRPVIGEALEMIVEDGLPVIVRMHPDDLARMQVALKETLGESGPEFMGDTQISPGGCIVSSASTSVDATVEKRWSRAVGNLGLSIDWEQEAPSE
jgi:flagellar assembly protein FliH